MDPFGKKISSYIHL